MRVGLLGPVAPPDLAPRLTGPVDHLPPGQAGSPVTLLADALIDLGHEVRIWTLDVDVAEPLTAAGPQLRLDVLPKRPGGRGRDAYAVEVGRLAQALAAGTDVDVLNPHWSYEFALGARGRPEPLVLTVHDWAPTILRYTPDAYRVARLAMFVRTHVRRPPMTTPSPYLRRLLRRFGLGDAAVVPNGVPVDRFAGPRRRGDGLHLVGVARGFDQRKNTRALLAAQGILRRAGVASTLALYGHAHEAGGPAQRWAASAGLLEGVDFVGDVPHDVVLRALGEADLFVHPAREESFGMVLVEAMAQGTPVVAGRASGAVPWVLGGGRAGVLVDVEDPGAIAEGVRRLLEDADRWEALSTAGHAHAREHFAMDRVAEGYLRAYAEVSGGHG